MIFLLDLILSSLKDEMQHATREREREMVWRGRGEREDEVEGKGR